MKQFVLLAFLIWSTAAQAVPEIYIIDTSQTIANFSFIYLGIANKTHKFDRTSGRIEFDPVTKTGSAEVIIEAASINTGVAFFNSQMRSPGFLDAAKHPMIIFKSSKMAVEGEQMIMTGELNIKGITRPVTLAINNFQCLTRPEIKADTCGAKATVTIKRSEFNMGKYALLASDNVTLNLTIGATKTQPEILLASSDINQ